MTPLVVATWNVWGGNAPGTYTRDRGISRGAIPRSPAARELDPRRTWERRRPLIVDALREANADLVALQESTREEGRSSCASEVAEELGFACVEDDHPRGLAVLSRCPIQSTGSLALPAATLDYPSPLLIELTHATGQLSCLVLHLPLERFGARTPLVSELARRLTRLPRPLVVCGDLNARPDDPHIATLLAAGLRDASADVGPTMPNPSPVVRLDYVLASSDLAVRAAWHLGEQPEMDGFLASDHLGVAVALEL